MGNDLYWCYHCDFKTSVIKEAIDHQAAYRTHDIKVSYAVYNVTPSKRWSNKIFPGNQADETWLDIPLPPHIVEEVEGAVIWSDGKVTYKG